MQFFHRACGLHNESTELWDKLNISFSIVGVLSCLIYCHIPEKKYCTHKLERANFILAHIFQRLLSVVGQLQGRVAWQRDIAEEKQSMGYQAGKSITSKKKERYIPGDTVTAFCTMLFFSASHPTINPSGLMQHHTTIFQYSCTHDLVTSQMSSGDFGEHLDIITFNP